IKPSKEVNEILEQAGASPLNEAVKATMLLKRPELSYMQIEPLIADGREHALSAEVIEQVEIQVKYEGYIQKQLQQIERAKKMENKKIPEDLDYFAIHGLAKEAQTNLSEVRPLSIGQASRVPGVNPADISI